VEGKGRDRVTVQDIEETKRCANDDFRSTIAIKISDGGRGVDQSFELRLVSRQVEMHEPGPLLAPDVPTPDPTSDEVVRIESEIFAYRRVKGGRRDEGGYLDTPPYRSNRRWG
jgi:hypothetical protein